MTKKILVVPDVHGRTFWKKPVGRLLESVDRVVFLGDYLDPYEKHRPEELYANLMEIIELKDVTNWQKYHEAFSKNRELFKIAHLEVVNGVPYVFSHAGLTAFWLNKVNANLWHLIDSELSVADQEVIDRINELENDEEGMEMLGVIGQCRTWYGGEKTGSVLWADINEHSLPVAQQVYDLNHVFQVFGHSRLDGRVHDMIRCENLAMIDSQKCFLIDADSSEKLLAVRN